MDKKGVSDERLENEYQEKIKKSMAQGKKLSRLVLIYLDGNKEEHSRVSLRPAALADAVVGALIEGLPLAITCQRMEGDWHVIIPADKLRRATIIVTNNN